MRATVVGLVLGAWLSLAAAPASANRALLSEAALEVPPAPGAPQAAALEGPCGLAFTPGEDLYVADYYHRRIAIFSPVAGKYEFDSQISLPGSNPPFGSATLDSLCQLALDSSGRLYANEWHEGAMRLLPSKLTFDEAESTGVAVDEAGDLYVDDRTHVAVYEPSGAPVLDGGLPLKIGLGSLTDGYGIAVLGGRVYVPDAATETVKVYEPAVDPDDPAQEISHGFVSLADAAVAVDPSNGHLLVVDNAQPGFEAPEAVIYEFDQTGAFLGKLPGAPVFGAPSGLAFAPDGTLYVTDGNGSGAAENVFEYSPYSASLLSSAGTGEGQAAAAPSNDGEASPGPSSQGRSRASRGQSTLVQKGSIRIALSGDLAPSRLPRKGVAPISVSVGGHISSTDPKDPPQLQRVSFAFNRAGRIDTRGLPRCLVSDIDPSTTRQALLACRDALVGEGQFSAKVRLPEQSPFPSAGKVLAFNGTLEGKPVIFAHIYGTEPVRTSIVLPLALHRAKGRFSTVLDASLADLTGDWGYVTGIELRLGRRYSFKGEPRSFLSAGCPAPKGFPGALFPLVRASFSFLSGRTLSATLTRSCEVR
jgi:DNA-binding beta-propeller fold protein YncE